MHHITILAHEKWFLRNLPSADWSFLVEPLTLVLVGAAVGAVLAWRAGARLLPVPEIRPLEPLGRLAPWVPRILAIHAGSSLLAQAASGSYLAPNLDLGAGPFSTLLAVVEGLLGVWLISGFRMRTAAAVLMAAGPLGMLRFGPVAILERADLLGIALFLVLLPRPREPAGAVPAAPASLARPLLALRVLTGVSLIAVAFTEKLIGPDLALWFLEEYPAFNVLAWAGISDLDFVRLAGAMEVFLGLMVISAAAPQATVLLAFVPLNATLFFLGTRELVGHLPLYGVLLALLVYGSNPAVAPLVPRLGRGAISRPRGSARSPRRRSRRPERHRRASRA